MLKLYNEKPLHIARVTNNNPRQAMQAQNYLTAKEAADFLNISVDTIHRWDKKGLIKAIRDGRNYRLFDIDSLKLLHDKINGSSSTPYKILKNDVKSGIKAIELFAGAGGTGECRHRAYILQ